MFGALPFVGASLFGVVKGLDQPDLLSHQPITRYGTQVIPLTGTASAIAEAFAPVLEFEESQRWFPSDVSDYLAHADLSYRGSVLKTAPLTLADLPESCGPGIASAHAVEAGRLDRQGVAELGHVLVGEEQGRRSDEEITTFDSTGLAVQDLAVARAVYERYLEEPGAFVNVSLVEL